MNSLMFSSSYVDQLIGIDREEDHAVYVSPLVNPIDKYIIIYI